MKKLIAVTLVFVLFVSSVSKVAMAAGNMSVGTGNVNYSGGNVNLQYFVSGNIPTMQGIPEHSSISDVFYSDQGCFRLKIDDPIYRRLFEDGAKVEVRFANKPAPTLHLNPFNWDKFLSYSPDGGDVNRLSIKGPQIKDGVTLLGIQMLWRTLPELAKALLSCIPAYLSYKVTDLACYLVEQSIWGGEGPSALGYAPAVAGVLTWFNCVYPNSINGFLSILKGVIKPAINLKDMFVPAQKSSTVDFKYGVVLTDRDDEKALSNNIDPLPREGDLDPDYANSEEQQKKAKIALKDRLSKIPDPVKAKARYPGFFDDEELKLLTKEKARKIADDRKIARVKAQRKLAEARPITEGLVCVLDADHPEQTFRLVMNNNLGGHDADLFSMALNSGTNFAAGAVGRPDRLSFTMTHVLPASAGAEAIRNRAGSIVDVVTASDKDHELMKKVATLVNTPNQIDNFLTWIGKNLSNIFSFSNSPIPGVPPAAVQANLLPLPTLPIVTQPGVQPTAPPLPPPGGLPAVVPEVVEVPEGGEAVHPPADDQQGEGGGELRRRHSDHAHFD